MFQSPWPSLRPYAPTTVPDLLRATALRLPAKAALITVDGAAYTFAEIWAGARSMARVLQDDGVRKGDIVAVYTPNSVEYAIVLYGAMLAGAAVTTLNPLYRAREAERQLADTGAKVLFAAHALHDAVHEVRPRLPGLHTVHEIEEAWDLARGAAGAPSRRRMDPAVDLAALPYSSGTTGLPKGVMLSHQNLTASIRQTLALQLTSEGATALDFLPFYHIYGMMALNCGLAIGLTQVILPRFDPEAVLSLIERHRVTDLYCVPPAILALVNAAGVGQHDLSSLRLILSGAAPLPLEVAHEAAARLGRAVVEGYGMTESSSTANATPVSAPREGYVGPPVADTWEKIIDAETGEELRPGEPGELLLLGPQVMLGYWKNAEATAEAIAPDGWLRTGDIASADADGYVRIHDRKKEMIKVKGYQVMPAELEAVLMEHPAVRDAAVIGKSDLAAGEVPKAFVVLRQPGVNLEDVQAFVAERVAPYKRLREIEVIDAIPRALSGKILRRQLVERERAAAAPDEGAVS